MGDKSWTGVSCKEHQRAIRSWGGREHREAPVARSASSNWPRLARAACLAAFGALALVAVTPAGGAGAANRRPSRAVTARQIQTAGVRIAAIPRSQFARGRRAALLTGTRNAARLARTTKACAALRAADRALNALSLPATWANRRVPTARIRVPRLLLVSAERALTTRAGKRCARQATTTSLTGRKGGSGAPKVQPPDAEPEQGDGLNKPIPAGPFRPVKSIGGQSAFGPDPHAAAAAAATFGPLASAASDPLAFFRVSDVGVPPRQASPQEPNEAIGRHVVWYTGNSSVALSTNDGRTFTTFDPSSVLPDSGLAFCCDQLVSYSRAQNLFVWVMQYWCNTDCLRTGSDGKQYCQPGGTYNRIRVAVASPEDLIRNASNPGLAWTYWDVRPPDLGLGPGAWFDRSDLSVNLRNMNWTVDAICGSQASVAGRISLAELAHRGTVTLSYFKPGGRMSAAQGEANTTTYLTSGLSGSQARVWSWGPFSATAFNHDLNHSSIPIFDAAMTGSDAGNSYGRYGIFPGAPESSTVSGSTLYVAYGTGRAYCTARCDKTNPALQHVFDQPAVLVTKVNVDTWTPVGERWLWNPTVALGWPALQTDDAGDVGIVMRGTTTNHNAQPVTGFLTPGEEFVWALPEGLPHETGDYYSLRPGRTVTSFLVPAQTVQNDPGGATMHWYSIEYGHGPTPYIAPPTVHITAPANSSSVAQGTTVSYHADVSDPVDGTLPAAAIVWTEDGSVIGTGPSITHVENAIGTHAISVRATNGDGKSASDAVSIRVAAPPGPISAAITSPGDGANLGYGTFNVAKGQYCKDVSFTSTAAGGGGSLTYAWSDQVSNTQGQVISPSQPVATGATPVITLCAGLTSNQFYTHNITLTVTDGKNTGQAFVSVLVGTYKLA